MLTWNDPRPTPTLPTAPLKRQEAFSALQQHPLSAAFPPMAPESLDALRDSIVELGVLNPITVFDGQVLDGWHRYMVTQELGYDCPTVELLAEADPRHFVIAQNKARRHVTQAQLAMAVTSVHAWKPLGANQHIESRVNIECAPSKSATELAELAGVHRNTIAQAKAVQANAEPAVIDAVQRGDIGLPKAAAIAKLPREQQAAAIAAPAPKPSKTKQPALASALLPATPAAAASAPIDGEVEKLRADVVRLTSENEELSDRLAETASDLAKLVEDNEGMARVFEADDKVVAALAEAARYRELNRVLNERVNGLLNEKNEAIRAARSWQRKAEGK
ncbi:MAG: hypothetical protein EON54_00225 [Alcaligenaceae bacterium]|nr:MAG: hypothetical protein EON54_00225 [Alcaligenaceae bacterium]